VALALFGLPGFGQEDQRRSGCASHASLLRTGDFDHLWCWPHTRCFSSPIITKYLSQH